MISINKYGENIDLSNIEAVKKIKSFSLDGLVLDKALIIEVQKGTKFSTTLQEEDLKIEFKDADGNIFELILKNMANLLAQNDGTQLVEIIEAGNDKVLASITDITSALEAAAAGPAAAAAANTNSDSAANSGLNDDELNLQNETYNNLVIEDDLAEDAPATVAQTTRFNFAPTIATIATQTVDEDGSTTITFIASDIDGDTLTSSATATNGTVSILGNVITYTPNANFNGSDLITLNVNDGSVTTTQTINVTVSPVNDAPTIATIATQTVDEDGSTTITFIASDIDGDTLTSSATATNGTVSILGNVITYTPNANFNGSDLITLNVNDGSVTTTQTINVTVSPVNDAPTIATIATQTVDEDGSTTITFIASDIDGDTLTSSATATNGTVSILGNVITYTPNANFNGSDLITLNVNDGSVTTTQTINVTVSPVNDAPTIATIATQTVDEDGSTTITFIASDIDGDTLTSSATATNGTVSILGNVITYTPNANFNGSDLITLNVNDGSVTTTQTINVTVSPVNDAPTIATIATQTVDEDGSTTITFIASDIDGDTLTSSATATNGTVSILGNVITYTPNANFNGSDLITLNVNDGSVTTTQTINVTVSPVNDAPTIATIATQTVDEDGSTTITFIASDIDGDTLTSSATATNGTVSILGNVITYTPNANFNGSDLITLNVNDGSVTTTQTINVTVSPVNDAPIAIDDYVSEPLINIGSIPTNGSAIKFEFDTLIDNEEIAFDWQFSSEDYVPFNDFAFMQIDGKEIIVLTDVNTENFQGNGIKYSTLVTQVLNNLEAGSHTIIFGVSNSDDDGVNSYLDITNLPSSFVKVDDLGTFISISDGYQISTDGVDNISQFLANNSNENDSVTIDVLANDIDIDSTTLTLSSVIIQGTKGEVSIVDNKLLFNPLTDFDYLAEGEITTVVVDYIMTDGEFSSSSTATIQLIGTNDAPVIALISTQTVDEDGSKTITFTASDIDGDTLTSSATATNGTATVSGNEITFTPTANFNGDATVTLTVNDGTTTTTQTINVTVSPVNDAPIVSSSIITVSESALTYATEEILQTIVTDADGKITLNISTSNSTIVGLFNQFDVESLVKNSILSLLPDNYEDNITLDIDTSVSGTVTVNAQITGLPSNPFLSVISQANLKLVLLDHLGTAFNLPLENAVYTGQITVSDVDNLSDVTLSLGEVSMKVTTTNSYLITLFEQLTTATPSLAYIQDLATDLINGNISISTTASKTINIPTLAVDALKTAGLLNITLDDNGEYKIISPLFNTMKGSDSIEISFDYTANDGIDDSNKGTTTVTITGVNDAPIAVTDSVDTEIAFGETTYEGTLPGSYIVNMLTDVLGNINLSNGLTGIIDIDEVLTAVKESVDINIDTSTLSTTLVPGLSALILDKATGGQLETLPDTIKTQIETVLGDLSGTEEESLETAIDTFITSVMNGTSVNDALVPFGLNIIGLYSTELNALQSDIQTAVTDSIETTTNEQALIYTKQSFIDVFANSSDTKPDITFDASSLEIALKKYLESDRTASDEATFGNELFASINNINQTELVALSTNTALMASPAISQESKDLFNYLATNNITLNAYIISLSTAAKVDAENDINTNETTIEALAIASMKIAIKDAIENNLGDATGTNDTLLTTSINTFVTSYIAANENSIQENSALLELQKDIVKIYIANPLTVELNPIITIANAITIDPNDIDLSTITVDSILTKVISELGLTNIDITTMVNPILQSTITELKTFVSSLSLSQLANDPDAIVNTFKDLLTVVFNIIDDSIDTVFSKDNTPIDDALLLSTLKSVLSDEISTALSTTLQTLISQLSSAGVDSTILSSLPNEINDYLVTEITKDLSFDIEGMKDIALESIFTQLGLDTGLLEEASRDLIAEKMVEDVFTRLSMDEDLLDIATLAYKVDGDVITTVYNEFGVDVTNTLTTPTTVTVDSDGSYTVTNSSFATMNTLYEVKVEFSYVVNDGIEDSEAKAVTLNISLADSSVSDGHIAGALVFEDLDGDKTFDDGEKSTYTDANGDFYLAGVTGPLVAIGGTDISTGLAFTGTLTAPAGSTVLSPLTTLVQSLMELDPTLSVEEASSKVKTSLGIDSSIDLTTYDSYAIATDSTSSEAAKETANSVQKIAVQLVILMTQESSALDSITDMINDSDNIDLTSVENITTILGTSDTNIINAISNLNQAVNNASLVSVEDISKVQTLVKDVIESAQNGTVLSVDEISSQASEVVVNKLPVVTIVSTLAANEDQSTALTFKLSDEDGTIEKITASAENGTVSVDGSEIIYLSNKDFNGTDIITIIATDDDGASTRKTISVTVTPTNDAPTLTVVSSTTVAEDGSKTITFIASDIDGDTLTSNVSATNGIAVISGNEITFIPSANYNGSAIITLTTNDGILTTTSTINVTVNPVNDAPTIETILTQTVSEDDVKTITFVASDIDGDTLTPSVTATNGTAQIVDGKIEFTPTKNFNGTATVTLSVNDGTTTTSQTFDVSVSPVNDTPVIALISTQTVNEDESQTITFTASDIDGDTLTSSVTATNGTATVLGNEITFTPTKDFNGTATVTLTVNDGTTTTTQTFNVTISPVNDAPVIALIATQTVAEDGIKTIAFTASDIDGDTLTSSVKATNGTAKIIDGQIEFTPTEDFNGTATVTLTVNDGTTTTSQTFNVIVSPTNDAPTIEVVESAIVNKNNDKTITFMALDIDSDLTTTATALEGTVEVNGNIVTYTPNKDYVGTDTITLTTTDGEFSATKTIGLTVNNSNDNPIVLESDLDTLIVYGTSYENSVYKGIIETVDGLNDNQTFTLGSNSSVTVNGVDVTSSIGNLGSVVVTSTGEFILNSTYFNSLAKGYVMKISFDVIASDGENDDITKTVSLTVTGTNDAPVISTLFTNSGNENTILSGQISASDVDIVLGINGLPKSVLTYSTTSTLGEFSLNSTTGAYTFDTNSYDYLKDGEKLVIEIPVSVTDGVEKVNSILKITITGTNDAPITQVDQFALSEDSVATFTALELLSNDSDIDGDNLSLVSVSNASNGIVSIVDGKVVFTPVSNYDGVASFNYVVTDGISEVEGTVNLTIDSVNDAPTAKADVVKVVEDISVDINVLLNDTDVEIKDLSIQSFTQPSYGTVTLNDDGTLKYTPVANAYGLSDSFEYTIKDQGGLTSTATVNLTITGTNDAPIAVSQTINEQVDSFVSYEGYLPGSMISALGNPQIDIKVSDLVNADTITVTPTFPVVSDAQITALKAGIIVSLGILNSDGTLGTNAISYFDQDKINNLKTVVELIKDDVDANRLSDGSINMGYVGMNLNTWVSGITTKLISEFELGAQTPAEITTFNTNVINYLYANMAVLTGDTVDFNKVAKDMLNLAKTDFGLTFTEIVSNNIPDSLVTAISNLTAVNSTALVSGINLDSALSAYTESSISVDTSAFDSVKTQLSTYLATLSPSDLSDSSVVLAKFTSILNGIDSIVAGQSDAVETSIDTLITALELQISSDLNSALDNQIATNVTAFVDALIAINPTINTTTLTAQINYAISSLNIADATVDISTSLTANDIKTAVLSDFGILGDISTVSGKEAAALTLADDLSTRVGMDADFEDISTLTYFLTADSVNATIDGVDISDVKVTIDPTGAYSVTSDTFATLDSSDDVKISFDYYLMDKTGTKSESETVNLNIDLTDSYSTESDDSQTLDMVTLLSNTSGLDELDMTLGEHILSNFSLDDFVSLTDEDNTLKIFGDGADKISLDSAQNWTQMTGSDGATPYTDPDGFHVYTTTNAASETLKLLIENTITVENV